MRLVSFRLLLIAIIATAAVGSFIAARLTYPTVNPEQILAGCPVKQALTEDFKTQAETLRKIHGKERQLLGRCLLDPNSSSEAIRKQADVVIEANNQQYRFVIEHLLGIEPSLSAAQKQQLFEYCGQIMRDGHHQPYTSGPHAISEAKPAGKGCPNCQSKQKTCDCTGLSSQLHLTQEQFDIASQANPNFASEARELAARVCHSHQELVALLEKDAAADTAIRGQTETFLQARSQLEQRTVDYIIAIRPCLSQQQIRQLTGMCGR